MSSSRAASSPTKWLRDGPARQPVRGGLLPRQVGERLHQPDRPDDAERRAPLVHDDEVVVAVLVRAEQGDGLGEGGDGGQGRELPGGELAMGRATTFTGSTSPRSAGPTPGRSSLTPACRQAGRHPEEMHPWRGCQCPRRAAPRHAPRSPGGGTPPGYREDHGHAYVLPRRRADPGTRRLGLPSPGVEAPVRPAAAPSRPAGADGQGGVDGRRAPRRRHRPAGRAGRA